MLHTCRVVPLLRFRASWRAPPRGVRRTSHAPPGPDGDRRGPVGECVRDVYLHTLLSTPMPIDLKNPIHIHIRNAAHHHLPGLPQLQPDCGPGSAPAQEKRSGRRGGGRNSPPPPHTPTHSRRALALDSFQPLNLPPSPLFFIHHPSQPAMTRPSSISSRSPAASSGWTLSWRANATRATFGSVAACACG